LQNKKHSCYLHKALAAPFGAVFSRQIHPAITINSQYINTLETLRRAVTLEEQVSFVFMYILNHPIQICIAAMAFGSLLGVIKANNMNFL